VQDVLDRVSREELAFQSMRSKKLRQLLSEDRSISDQLAAVTAHMERQERLHYQNITRGAALRASTTKWLILFALSASATLLILLIGVILRDMTRLRRNRTQLRTAVEEAEKLARVKQEFLSNMSHEIRTPLTAIAGFAEQLNQSSLDEAQKRQLDRLMRAAGHLQSLVADLLDMSKMEQGALVLQKVPFSLKQTMSDVLDIFRGTARNKGIELRYQPPDGDADLLMGDPLRLRQILINLLGNAITFTDEGYVALRCRLESRENGWMLLVEVEDSGIGIPEGEQERIFEVFTQVDNALTRRHGGTGLGLSIVKYLVELHGGEIRVQSQVGTGTVFFVQLPCVPADSGSTVEMAREGHPPYPNLRGRRILVVDDDPFIRELIGTIFQKRDAGVVQVPDAASALEQIRSHTFDLILMDLRMPGLSGADAVRVIRRLQPGVHQPIVAVTADSGVSGLAESGFDGALVKPFTQEEIERLVYRFLEPGSTAEAVVTGPSDQKAGDDQFSLDELQAMSGGNPDFVRDMVVMYLKNMTDYLRTLEQAAGEGAWQQVGDIAHKAAPACRHLGLRRLAASFRQLEQHARASDAGQAEVEMKALKHAWSLQSANVELAMQSLDAHPGEAGKPDRRERIARID
jgi:signal transduction histidine kinase/HPt (histidine-containing phosphotransfer) domain-containing protein